MRRWALLALRAKITLIESEQGRSLLRRASIVLVSRLTQRPWRHGVQRQHQGIRAQGERLDQAIDLCWLEE